MTHDVAPRRRKKAPKTPIELELTLGDWGQKGGVQAEHESRRMTVDRGIPGELVVAEVDRRTRPWRGVAREIVHPSSARISPSCPYFVAGCGGCQWQHVGYDDQLAAKRLLVDREMEGAGVDARVEHIYPMETPWRYRHTAAIAIGWEAGFRPRARKGIIEIRDCPISHPVIGRLSDALNDLLRGGRLPNYHGKVWLDCTVVGSRLEPSVQVLLQGVQGLTLETHPELPDVAEETAKLDVVSSVAYRHRSGEPRPLVGDLMSQIEVDGKAMWLPAGSFFQTNLQMLDLLLSRMRNILHDGRAASAADVYGGVGTFALHLAREVDTMLLVELDPFAVQAAQRTAQDWRLENLTFESRHAERALPHLPALDVIIVDPPRSGLGTTVTDALIANGAPLVLYVSCAPGSLARDLAQLQDGGYRISSLEAFDFYPQTYHVESLAVLRK